MHWQSAEIARHSRILVYERRSGNISQGSPEIEKWKWPLPLVGRQTSLNPDLAVGEVAAVAVQARLCTDRVVLYGPVVAARHGWDKKSNGPPTGL